MQISCISKQRMSVRYFSPLYKFADGGFVSSLKKI